MLQIGVERNIAAAFSILVGILSVPTDLDGSSFLMRVAIEKPKLRSFRLPFLDKRYWFLALFSWMLITTYCQENFQNKLNNNVNKKEGERKYLLKVWMASVVN